MERQRILDASSTYVALEASGANTAILPVGAIEQHGPHLPLSVDHTLAETIARGVGLGLNAFVLPGMPFGTSKAHIGFRGSVWLEHCSLHRVVVDLVSCLFDQGFQRVVIINMHGGNVGLTSAVRDANNVASNGKAIVVNPLVLAREELAEVIETLGEERHAGELETSLMLHLCPDLVIGTGPDCVPAMPSEYFDVLPLRQVSSSGVWGRPSRASAEKGAMALSIMVQASVRHVLDVFSRLEGIG